MLISRAFDRYTIEGTKTIEEIRDILALEIGRIIVTEHARIVPSKFHVNENMVRIDIVVDSMEEYFDNHRRVTESPALRAYDGKSAFDEATEEVVNKSEWFKSQINNLDNPKEKE
ncbi:MAG TPA: hypothetical protein PLT75_15260 [Spirochaetota bacterium]|nr:hypothetical protein [Spirochaetota bacterium]